MNTYLYYNTSAVNSSNTVSGVVPLDTGADSGIRIRAHITSAGSAVTVQLQVYCTSTNIWRYYWNKAWVKINGVTIFSWTDGDAGSNPHGFGAGGANYASLGTIINASQWTNWPVNANYSGQPTGGSATTDANFTLQVMVGDRYFNSNDVTWTSSTISLTNDTADGWNTATPYVYDGGSWKQATPYIWNGSSWVQATTYVKQ